MSHIVIHTATTAAGLAAQRQQMMAEEEQMTTYTNEELEQDWEFKIVRANSAIFGKPEALQTLLQEEAVAGWTMLEKFDNTRIRFKRPRATRELDAYLPQGVDPYRTQYGTPAFVYAVAIIGALILMVLLLVVIVVAMA